MLRIKVPPKGFKAEVISAMVRVKCLTKDCPWSTNLTGRPGKVTVTCTNCGKSSSLTYEQVRLSPHSFDLAITEGNKVPDKHGRYRVRTSYIYVCIIYSLAVQGKIRQGAAVVAPGASLQVGGAPGSGNQLAHQVFREVTVDGTYIYELSNLTDDEKAAIIYCCSVCSDIGAIYNEADGLVERELQDNFVALVKDTIAWVHTGPSQGLKVIFSRLLFIFELACTEASGKLEGGYGDGHDQNQDKLTKIGILNGYIRACRHLNGKSDEIINVTIEGWISDVKKRLVTV